MKTIFKLIFSAVLALAATACTLGVDDTQTPADSEQTTYFKVFTESATTTKAYADKEQMKVFWNKDDLLTVFNNSSSNDQYIFVGENGDEQGRIRFQSSGNATSATVNKLFAVYPYDGQMKISSKEKITVALPAVQYYKEDSFGIGANTMVAVSTDNNLSFKNVCGYLCLQLYGNKSVSQIKIEGRDELIAGVGDISFTSSGLPVIAMRSNFATKSITLVCDPPVALGATAEAHKDFWFVIPPITFTQGFTITVTDESGDTWGKTTQNPLTVTRSTLDWMKPLEVFPLTGKVFLAGDSHVSSSGQRVGWGDRLQVKLAALQGCRLNPQVDNKAQGGRSTKDFETYNGNPGRWYLIYNNLSPGDLVLIEFGPNDYDPDMPGHTTLDEYQENLEWYILQTLNKGAQPVLVTPPNKCEFLNGVLQPSPWCEYSDRMRYVAYVTNTPLVDLENLSRVWIEGKGSNFDFIGNDSYYLPDHGHLREKGATLYAGMIAEELLNLGYWY